MHYHRTQMNKETWVAVDMKWGSGVRKGGRVKGRMEESKGYMLYIMVYYMIWITPNTAHLQTQAYTCADNHTCTDTPTHTLAQTHPYTCTDTPTHLQTHLHTLTPTQTTFTHPHLHRHATPTHWHRHTHTPTPTQTHPHLLRHTHTPVQTHPHAHTNTPAQSHPHLHRHLLKQSLYCYEVTSEGAKTHFKIQFWNEKRCCFSLPGNTVQFI